MRGRISRTCAIGAVLAAAATSAGAGESLQFGPPEAWVRPVTPAPAAPRATSRAPWSVLTRSLQDNYTDGGNTLYTETMVRIQTPQGLDAGDPTVQWDPTSDTITINKALILRDGKVIDLLARGGTFSILRREPELEKDMLDGELTAVMQADGVQVGDVVDFAFTLSRKIDVLKDHSEDLLSGVGSQEIGARLYRFIWPANKPMHWRLSDDLPPPDLVKGGDVNELTLNFAGYKKPDAPDQAPKRFARFGDIQFSQFSTWNEVSALMAPYYDRAATLAANSPLKDEVAKIRALSDDPKVRAAAALHLVEEKVRYTSVHANDAGFIPPSADLSWSRRWADCKGKTALLTAFLRELGITADPALVDLDAGGSLHDRLPALALFDHIIVRAMIGGKTYWLDGTRDTDGDLDNLGIALEKWALPVTDAGEDLQPIALPVPQMPRGERSVRVDASAGLDAPAPAHVEIIDRGSHAFVANQNWQTYLPERLDEVMRAFWHKSYPWIAIGEMSESFDPVKAEMRYVLDGTAHMKWSKPQGVFGRLYKTDGYELADDYKPVDRKPGVHADAPVSVEFPLYLRSTETITLPAGGKGFDIIGSAVDETLGGLELKRTLTIDNGVFSMETTQRSLTPEIPLAQAKADAERLKDISESMVFIEAPAGMADAASGADAANGSPAAGTGGSQTTVSGDDALWRGADMTDTGRTPATPPDLARKSGLSLDDLAELYAGRKRHR